MKLKIKLEPRWGILLSLSVVLALTTTPGNASAQITLVNVGYVSNTGNNGVATAIVVSNGYAYLANGPAGLCVFDVSNPANPVLKGQNAGHGPAEALALSGNYAYVASDTNGLEVYNISNPSDILAVGHTNNGTEFATAKGVAVSGNYVYLANGGSGLIIYDVSTPSAPGKVAETNEGAANSVLISGNYAYVACGDDVPTGVTNALVVNDISNPTNPVVVTRAAGTKGIGTGLAISGNLLYLVQQEIPSLRLSPGLGAFDVSNPAAPRYLGLLLTSESSNVKVLGDYVFLAALADGLIVYDTTNGTNLVSVGHVANSGNFGSCVDVAVSGDYAYVANGEDGLRIYAMMPQLHIQVAQPNSLLFSWLGPASFALQQTADPTSSNWTMLTNIPLAIGPTNQVTLPMPAGNTFYRLISQ